MADINRGTCYLHFIDKYDLADKVADHYYHFFNNIMQGDLVNQPEHIIKVLHFIYQERDFYSQMINIPSLNFEDKISMTLERLLTNIPHLNDSLNNRFMPFLNLPQTYSFIVLIMTITNIIALWIKRDFQESPEKVAQMILSLAKAEKEMTNL